jgi:hypothetical protein
MRIYNKEEMHWMLFPYFQALVELQRLDWPEELLPEVVLCTVLKGGLSTASLLSFSHKTNVDAHKHIQSSLWDQVCAVTKVRNIVASLKKPPLNPQQAAALGATELHFYHNQIEWNVGSSTSYQTFKENLYIERFFGPHLHDK